jgi:hypothetical protein
MRTTYALATLILLVIGAHAEPQNIREREAWEEKFLVVDAHSLNKTCATSITVRFDWSDVPEADLVTYGAENHVGHWRASDASVGMRREEMRSGRSGSRSRPLSAPSPHNAPQC